VADPIKTPQVQQIATEWEKLVATQVANLEAFFGQMTTLEGIASAQLLSTWEAAGRHARESLAQVERIGSEWRKLAVEAARRTTQAATPKSSS